MRSVLLVLSVFACIAAADATGRSPFWGVVAGVSYIVVYNAVAILQREVLDMPVTVSGSIVRMCLACAPGVVLVTWFVSVGRRTDSRRAPDDREYRRDVKRL